MWSSKARTIDVPDIRRKPDGTTETEPGTRVPVWLGDLLGVVLVVSAALIQFPETEFPGGAAQPIPDALIGLVLAAAATLPLRRRWPLVALGSCGAISIVAGALGIAAQAIAIATALAMYSAANNKLTQRQTIAAAGAVIAVVGGSTLLVPHGDFLDPRLIQFATLIGLGAAVGDAARSRREYGAAAEERAQRAEQTREVEAQRRVVEERLRIARDLHDTVAHQISVISLQAGAASSVLESQPERARAALGTVRQAARTVLTEIGDLLFWLRSQEDSSSVDPERPQLTLQQLDELLARFAEAGLVVDVETSGSLAALPEAASTVAYRVIQEGLTNAHRHGSKNAATLSIEAQRNRLRIQLTNPVEAQRFSSPDGARGGYGLLGLRERIASVRGDVEVGPVPGGFRLHASIPLSKEQLR